MSTSKTPLPRIVSEAEWQSARDKLLVKEKELTRTLDALAAERRRLPMMRIDKAYAFEGPNGKVTLPELFQGRRQLILYHFMFGPTREAGCPGCSMFVDQLGHLAHLNARDTSFAAVSRAPIGKIEAYRRRMGWTFPWVSSFGTDFNPDLGVGPKEPQTEEPQDGEHHALSVLLRDGTKVFRTYFVAARGVERLGNVWSLLDLTPYGRQEAWEDSPRGWPQSAPYQWWRRHDEYASAAGAAPPEKETIVAIGAQKIAPCLWFDTEAEAAANFYISIFKDSTIRSVNRYNRAGTEIHGKPPGSVMAVEFEIEGQKFVALNGGPQFKFDEAISFQIHCKNQEEIDYYWSRLTEGGKEVACGWLKDKFGLSWQVVPTQLFEMLSSGDAAKRERVTAAFMQMKKFDIAKLTRAFEGRE